jgi:hypothetical protein
MNLEQSICELVKQHWDSLHPDSRIPDSLVFLKVAGKTSANAAIIAMILDAGNRLPVAIAKIPRNPRLAPGLKREYAAMVDLKENIGDEHILAHTTCRGRLVEKDDITVLLQEAGLGHPMVREMSSRETIEMLYKKILSWMLDFHAQGSEKCVLAGDVLREFVETPIENFMTQFGNVPANMLSEEARQYLSELPEKVEGRTVHLCRQHGDFNAHNILVEYDRGRLDNFMLFDWEDYQPCQLPIHDLNHFFTSNSHLLGAGMSPVDSYVKFTLGSGWYHELYVKASAVYDSHGLIDRETYWLLLPLYLAAMCSRVAEAQRQQKNTSETWIKRMNAFVDWYSGGRS